MIYVTDCFEFEYECCSSILLFCSSILLCEWVFYRTESSLLQNLVLVLVLYCSSSQPPSGIISWRSSSPSVSVVDVPERDSSIGGGTRIHPHRVPSFTIESRWPGQRPCEIIVINLQIEYATYSISYLMSYLIFKLEN